MKNCLKYHNIGGIGTLSIITDPHLIDERGMTVLHWALKEDHFSPSLIARLVDVVHPHVMTYDGLTPLDLARQMLRRKAGTSK